MGQEHRKLTEDGSRLSHEIRRCFEGPASKKSGFTDQGGVVCLAGLHKWRLLGMSYVVSPQLGARFHLGHA